MKRIRKLTRFTALLLILAVSLTLFPVSGTDTAAPAAEPVSTEVLSLREENVKHFAVGNNTYQAVAYGHPVHKLDEDGNWVDIDNSLTLSGSSYATEDGRVSFVQSFAPNQALMTLAEDGTSVSMALLTLQSGKVTAERTATARVVNPNNLLRTAEDAMNAVFSSSVTYEGVLPDTDLEYTVDAGSVKEYIVVNKPQTSYTYRFSLTLGGLTARMEEDGSVGLYTAEDERKYTIPAPYMFDAAESFSEDVAYTLQGESGKYFLTVTADPQWLNDPSRVWPVKIDPTVTTEEADDTYISSSAPGTNYGTASQLVVGTAEIAYIKTPIIVIPRNAALDWAELRVYYYFPAGVTGYTINVGAYPVENYWQPNTLTWNTATQNGYGQLADSCVSTNALLSSSGATSIAPQQAAFTITGTAEKWWATSSCHGVALKRLGGTSSFVYIKSYESSETYRPRIVYQYTTYENVYTYINTYDSTFTSYTNLIAPTVQAVSKIFREQFNCIFRWENTTAPITNLTEDCELANNQKCTDENCGETHHKDLVQISDALYYGRFLDAEDEPQNGDEISVLWTDRPANTYCYHDPECATRSSFACVVQHRPVITILRLPRINSSLVRPDASAGIILAHETAHTFGMHEAYDYNSQHLSDGWQCVMDTFDTDDSDFAGFFDAICLINGATEGFCDYCMDYLPSHISDGLYFTRFPQYCA